VTRRLRPFANGYMVTRRLQTRAKRPCPAPDWRLAAARWNGPGRSGQEQTPSLRGEWTVLIWWNLAGCGSARAARAFRGVSAALAASQRRRLDRYTAGFGSESNPTFRMSPALRRRSCRPLPLLYYDDLLLRRSFHAAAQPAAFLIRVGLLTVWLQSSVSGFRPVLARGWHEARCLRAGDSSSRLVVGIDAAPLLTARLCLRAPTR
jgi:hypothetical protein